MNYRTERLPVVTLSLIGVNTLVLVVQMICAAKTGGASDQWVMSHLWLTPNQSVWYTYVTSMFVHAGIMHLLGNMIFLFLFGCCVEDMIGRGRFLLYYLLGGLAAEWAFIAVTPEHFASGIPLGGASGAISACLGMYLLLRTHSDIEFKYFYFWWLFLLRFGSGEFAVPAWMAIGFWFLKDLFWMILGRLYPQAGGGVAFGAHVGGLLAGLGLVALNLRFFKPKPEAHSTEILSPDEIRAAHAFKHDPADLPTIYLCEDGVQTGPHTLAQIQARLAQKELDAKTIYWMEGMKAWENVMDLAESKDPDMG
jgi:membrane associated rhomboid family serine protease